MQKGIETDRSAGPADCFQTRPVHCFDFRNTQAAADKQCILQGSLTVACTWLCKDKISLATKGYEEHLTASDPRRDAKEQQVPLFCPGRVG